MNLPEVKIEDLLEAGVHFGHNVRRWNPKMEDYIFGVRNNIHIFDLRITLEALNSSLVKIHETVAKSGKILFVGTKKQCSESVKELAKSFWGRCPFTSSDKDRVILSSLKSMTVAFTLDPFLFEST